jgi:hypothetical protein
MAAVLDRMTAESPEVLDAIASVLDDAGRAEFLAGYAERVARFRSTRSAGDASELDRWVAEWLTSARLLVDPGWHAADDEATKLVDAGKVGAGTSMADLRAAVRRR